MDAELITPFMRSIQNVFATMLQLPVTVGEPSVRTESGSTYDVSGIVGMSGDVIGSVVLSFPSEAAERIASIFAGQQMNTDDEDFADAIGELINMVAGGAKGMFKDRNVSISCPSVVVGAEHKVSRPKNIPCISIPCQTDCGEVSIEIAIQDVEAKTQGESSTASQAA